MYGSKKILDFDIITNIMTRREKMFKAKKLIHEFRSITMITVPFGIFGIRMEELDVLLNCGDRSMKDTLSERYGTRAVEIIEELMGIDLL